MSGPLLSVETLAARHGLLQAVRGVSFDVAEGEVLALVGTNGAGKTTLLRTVAGAHPAFGGTVFFDGRDVTRLPAHSRVSAGIALVPEGRRLFTDLTAEENLLVAGGRARRGDWTVDRVVDVFPMLGKVLGHRAASLSGGEQQAVAIGRALMTNPRLLLLDEVSLGLAPAAVDAVYECLGTLVGSGATIVLVEQDLRRALATAQRVLCLLEGRVVLAAPVADVSHEQVAEASFGLRRPPRPAPAPAPTSSEPT